MKKIAQHLTLFLSLCCCLWSCKSDLDRSLQIQKVNTIKIKGDIPSTGFAVKEYSFLKSGRNEKGTQYLVFQDSLSFVNVYNALNNQEYTAVRTWSQKVGFNSLRNIYEDAIAAEMIEREKGANITEFQIERLKEHNCISDEVYQNRDLFTLDREEGMGLKIYDIALADVVNRDGIVQIGKNIFQHGENQVKVITDGDASKIELLGKTTQSNSAISIYVYKVNNRMNPKITNSSGRTEQWTRMNEVSWGSPAAYKTLLYEDFVDITYYSGIEPYYVPFTQYSHFMTLRNLKRGFLGFWYNSNYLLSLSGQVTYTSNPPGVGNFNPYSAQPSLPFHTLNVNFLSNYSGGVNAIPQGSVVTGSHIGTGDAGTLFLTYAVY